MTCSEESISVLRSQIVRAERILASDLSLADKLSAALTLPLLIAKFRESQLTAEAGAKDVNTEDVDTVVLGDDMIEFFARG